MADQTVSPQMILLLDDRAACRTALALLCDDLWPDVVCQEAASLDEVAAFLSQWTPDLVLADLRLEASTPVETVTFLSTHLPPDIPLVLISGSVLPLEGYDMLRLGADAFVVKGRELAETQNIVYMAWCAAVGRRKRQTRA